MKFTTAVALFAVAAIAAPIEVEIEAREAQIEARANPTTCGNNYYSTSQVQQAVNAACSTTAGDYPHQYNNYEGFTSFPDPSPWYEFPITEGGVYTGGSPGADRVIIDGNCNYQGSITHTGASGNSFVGCSDTS